MYYLLKIKKKVYRIQNNSYLTPRVIKNTIYDRFVNDIPLIYKGCTNYKNLQNLNYEKFKIIYIQHQKLYKHVKGPDE